MSKPQKKAVKNAVRLIDQPHYSYWQALYLAFYSKRLYIDVAKRWRGFGLLYLILLIAIATIPLSIRLIMNFNDYFNQQLFYPIEKMPPIFVQNGQVKFDKPMPYFVKNDAQEVIVIIDTTGQIEQIDNRYPHLAILMTKDKIYFQSPRLKLFMGDKEASENPTIYEQSLDPNMNEMFVGKQWIKQSGVLTIKHVTEWLIYPIMVGFIFGIYFVFSWILALIGQIFAQMIFKVKLSFQGAYRIFVVAATAQVVLFLLSLAINMVVPGEGYLFVILLAVYFNMAILMIKSDSKNLVIA